MSRPTALRRRFPRGVAVFFSTLVIGLVAIFAVSELLLPSLAERRLRSDLAENATGAQVELRAEPAIKLLFGRADRVDVRVKTLRIDRGGAGDLTARAGGVAAASFSADRVDLQGLRLDDVELDLRDHRITVGASVEQAAIEAKLPPGVRLTKSREGTLAVKAGVRGLNVTALLQARSGKLVVAPESLLGGVLSFTLWSDPRVWIDSIDVTEAGGGQRTVAARARLAQ